jgi:hypothetical protein
MYKLTFGGLLLFVISCNSSSMKENKINESTTVLSKIRQMEWIIGKWENITRDGSLYEIWTKTNDTIYSGRSFMIANNDTVFSERISLELKKNELFYIPTVCDQNNAQPITFKLVSNEKNEIIFENKEHDFPQRIIYTNSNPDSLYARVEGNDNGKFRKEEFFMKRSRQR